jgi:hypothetical protein
VLSELTKASPVPVSPLAADSSSSSGDSGIGSGPVALIVVALFVVSVAAVAALRRRSRMGTAVKTAPAPPGGSRPSLRSWRGSRRYVVVAILVMVTVLVAVVVVRVTSGPGNASGSTPFFGGARPVANPSDVVVAAAGDISCPADAAGLTEEKDRPDSCHSADTAALVRGMKPDAVLALGDLQYPNGSFERFQAAYDKTWGAFKGITYPVVGNHEYGSPDAQGYFRYFGAAAGEPGSGYYSYDLGAWHIVALNANCQHVGGCGPGSPQAHWLEQDLRAHATTCTLAYWHQPRFSSGTHGSDPAYDTFWRILFEARADVVLNGHDHDYERFAPLTPDGRTDAAGGVTEFVVGTGGNSHYKLHSVVPGSQVRLAKRHGILQLSLKPDSFSWGFQTTAGAGNADAGSTRCH